MRVAFRLLAPALLLALAVAAPATVRADRIDDVAQRIQDARAREGVLTSEISAATTRIRALEGEVAPLRERVARLEVELADRRAELAALSALVRSQTRRLAILERSGRVAQRRLDARLVALYQNEPPDLLAIVLASDSFGDLIDGLQLWEDIARRDREIAEQIRTVQAELAVTRRRTAADRERLVAVARELALRTADARDARDVLLTRLVSLQGARDGKQELLAAVRAQRHEDEEDLEEMLAAGEAIAARLRERGSVPVPSAGSASAAGFVWPVHGAITSGFGPRCLLGLCRMHEGLDIAAPAGTPIRAAAAGTVVWAGWQGGYGNLVVIDHGGGRATAYGHQSAIYVGLGPVGQGQVLGAVGSTGRSTGPHLHFEVRIAGTAVDPLGYL